MKYTITLLTVLTFFFSAWSQEDGTIDTSFLPDNTGRKGAQRTIYEIVEQSDGKVIIAGQFNSYNQIERQSLVRVNADGSMDTDFNQTNFVTQGTSGSDPFLNAVAIQQDGKIIVGGKFVVTTGAPNFELLAQDIVRLNPDGTRDSSFVAIENVTPCGDIEDIIVQADGKIIV